MYNTLLRLQYRSLSNSSLLRVLTPPLLFTGDKFSKKPTLHVLYLAYTSHVVLGSVTKNSGLYNIGLKNSILNICKQELTAVV